MGIAQLIQFQRIAMGEATVDMGGLKCVVLDTGSGTTKVGYAGEDAPRSVFPSLVARSRGQDKSLYIGSQVYDVPSEVKLNLKYPIERAVPEDWSSLETVWEYALKNELEISPEETALVLTDAPMSVD